MVQREAVFHPEFIEDLRHRVSETRIDFLQARYHD